MIMEQFGLSPSKQVGIIKDALKDAMLDGLIPNTFEAANEFMLFKAREMGLTPKNPKSTI
jgi:tRNA nucleotidyltransferase (CCA-adding enzyme)